MLAGGKLTGLKGTRLLEKAFLKTVQFIPLLSYTTPFKSTNTLNLQVHEVMVSREQMKGSESRELGRRGLLKVLQRDGILF